MLLLAAFAAAAAPPPKVSEQARATVRVEKPVRANSREWEKLPASSRRETIVRDESGNPLLLRLVELP